MQWPFVGGLLTGGLVSGWPLVLEPSLTGDYKLAEMNKCDSAIVNYDGTQMAVIGVVCATQ